MIPTKSSEVYIEFYSDDQRRMVTYIGTLNNRIVLSTKDRRNLHSECRCLILLSRIIKSLG